MGRGLAGLPLWAWGVAGFGIQRLLFAGALPRSQKEGYHHPTYWPIAAQRWPSGDKRSSPLGDPSLLLPANGNLLPHGHGHSLLSRWASRLREEAVPTAWTEKKPEALLNKNALGAFGAPENAL